MTVFDDSLAGLSDILDKKIKKGEPVEKPRRQRAGMAVMDSELFLKTRYDYFG
jgi:hypothetical protein